MRSNDERFGKDDCTFDTPDVALRFFKLRNERDRNQGFGMTFRAQRCYDHDHRRDEDQHQCGERAGHWDPDHAAESLEELGFESELGLASELGFASVLGFASELLDDSLLALFAGRESVL